MIKIAVASLAPCSLWAWTCLLSFEVQSRSPDPELRERGAKPRRQPGSERGESVTPRFSHRMSEIEPARLI